MTECEDFIQSFLGELQDCEENLVIIKDGNTIILKNNFSFGVKEGFLHIQDMNNTIKLEIKDFEKTELGFIIDGTQVEEF